MWLLIHAGIKVETMLVYKGPQVNSGCAIPAKVLDIANNQVANRHCIDYKG